MMIKKESDTVWPTNLLHFLEVETRALLHVVAVTVAPVVSVPVTLAGRTGIAIGYSQSCRFTMLLLLRGVESGTERRSS